MVSEKKKAINRKYREKNRRTVTVDISRELFDEFEAACEREGVAKASVLRAAIEAFTEA